MPRPLKIFTVEGYVSHIPPAIINDILGAPRHVCQGRVYTVARTKKDAVRFFNDAGLGIWKATHIHEGSGIHLDEFVAHTGLLNPDDDTTEGRVAVSWGMGGERFAVKDTDGWKLIGETTHKDPAEPGKFLQKPIFVPVEQKPEPTPVRVVIEIDPDMDPELVERLIPGVRCVIGFGRITAHEVVGKIVEP